MRFRIVGLQTDPAAQQRDRFPDAPELQQRVPQLVVTGRVVRRGRDEIAVRADRLRDPAVRQQRVGAGQRDRSAGSPIA